MVGTDILIIGENEVNLQQLRSHVPEVQNTEK